MPASAKWVWTCGFVALLGVTGAALAGIGEIRPFWIVGVATALGAAFVLLDFGFTAGFRDLLTQGDGRALAVAAVIPAVAALAILPISAAMDSYSRFVAPVGLSLIAGAALFGVGMQIANGCGSGCLVAAGQGSRRMLVALPFFALGGVIGTLILPTALTWPSLGVVDFVALFGPWGGLAAVEGLLAVLALVVLRGTRPDPVMLSGAAIIGVLAGLLFLVAGEPWGITMGLTLVGAKAVQAVGGDLSHFSFWATGGARDLLAAPALAMPSALSDVGLLLGAGLAASLRGKMRFGIALPWHGVAGAALGGLLMGIGARLAFGCNIGAFVSGTASGSLHGLVWIVAVLPGCWLGIRLRPWFEPQIKIKVATTEVAKRW